MVEITDKEKTDTWRLFLETFALVMRNLDRRINEDQAIPATWFDVLLHLHEAPESRLRIGELAESLVLTPSNATRLFDRLEKAGYLRREAIPEDRRGAYVVLKEEGETAFMANLPGNRSRVEEIFLKHLTDKDFRDLYRALSKVYKANKGSSR